MNSRPHRHQPATSHSPLHHAGAAKRVGGPPQQLRRNPPSSLVLAILLSCQKMLYESKSPYTMVLVFYTENDSQINKYQ